MHVVADILKASYTPTPPIFQIIARGLCFVVIYRGYVWFHLTLGYILKDYVTVWLSA